ncbi:tetratricopeptide repeat-containing sensor histidine kinase [Dokdonia sinensis]|nr:tetratricopeptide repeat-containing sensor histidine kinase [Dokdonia sinensis]
MKTFLLVALSFCASILLKAQTPQEIVDSIKIELSKNPLDERKVKLLGDATWYYSMISADSSRVYGLQSLEFAKKIEDSVAIAQAYNDLGIAEYVAGNNTESMSYYERALKLRRALKDTMGVASVYGKVANIYFKQTLFDSATKYYIDAIKIYEDRGQEQLAARLRGNVGAIKMEMQDYESALEYYKDNEIFFQQFGDSQFLANTYINTGNVYVKQKIETKAIENLEKGLAMAERIGYLPSVAASINNLAVIYNDRQEFKKAKDLILKGLAIRQSNQAALDIASSQLSLGIAHLGLEEYKKGEKELTEALSVFKREGKLDQIALTYEALTRTAYGQEDWQKAEKYLTDYIIASQAFSQKQTLSEVTEMETKYQTEKKENQILEQRAQLAENELSIRRKNNLIYGAIAVAVLLGLLGYLVYNQQRLKNRQLKKESELQTALAKIETQNRLQEQRLRISRDLHDNIGSQLTFIISSLDTLKYGLKDADSNVTDKLSDIAHFTKTTINELRDTIWAMNKEEITFEDLQSRISNFIDSARKAASDVAFKFNIDGDIDKQYAFTSVEGINLYRVIQESVNNGLKYAFAKAASNKEISVNIHQEPSQFRINIIDNGQGFDTGQPALGNGLNNMKKRIKDVNGDLTILSIDYSGTKVEFTIPKTV